ncbi:MAG TPA: tripartite tricarboxylate transporter substrate-binding protein [Stellaceae bacterium]|jgi:tripartite-type tricarboxylate transporter receptor subunit TctC|nr:tripartite tricarboxylate transporter substrate-binding protein [Stellaceae bacterium]
MAKMLVRRDALKFMGAGAAAATGLTLSPPSFADTYPSRPITMLCAFAPGGYVDNIARVLAPSLGRIIGQPVNVLDMPGANGMLGEEYYLRQPDDGYVLLADSVVNIIQNILVQKAPIQYDAFSMINLPARDYTLVATSAENNKIKSIGDVIDALRKDPKHFSIGVAPATPDYVNLTLFANAIGVDRKQLRLVTADSGPMRTQLIGNVIDLAFSGGEGFRPLAEQIRPLMVFDQQERAPYKAPAVPEVPALKSIEYVPGSLRGFACHRSFKEKTPDRYAAVVQAYERTFKDPATVKLLKTQSLAYEWYGPDSSNEIYERTYRLMKKYAALLKST